jgi:hypothetical protein
VTRQAAVGKGARRRRAPGRPTGAPSKAAVEQMLSSFGWSFVYYGWHLAGIQRWDGCMDYQDGWRVTLRVDCAPSEGQRPARTEKLIISAPG